MSESSALPTASSLQIMRVLLAKDWRLFRAPMIALTVIGLWRYLIWLTPMFGMGLRDHLFNSLLDWQIGACDPTALFAAVFGGIAIAGERSNGAADFLAVLPITRGQIIFSKWMVSAVMVGACMFLHFLLAYSFQSSSNIGQLGPGFWARSAVVWIGFTTSFFGIAWLLSTFTRSGPISTCVSIGLTIAIFFQEEISDVPPDVWARCCRLALPPLSIGLASLIVGTLYYLRRVAP
jgi:hypothetical protein